MKSAISIALGLTSLAAALPAAGVERVLPLGWQYKITALRGPGCPDFGQEDGANGARTTRLTYGQNTMDGSEIYYWFLAMPHLRVALDGDDHSWCETELSYEEFGEGGKGKADDYRLRLHKNGTRVIATYDLEKGVKATFKFAYDAGDDTVRLPIHPLPPSLTNHHHTDYRYRHLERPTCLRPVPKRRQLARLRRQRDVQAAQLRRWQDQVQD
jgi:hypothetical protein